MSKFNNKKPNKSYRGNHKPSNPKENPKAPTEKKTEEEASSDMRLSKYIAHCGICSRRKANELIKEGKVKINDTVIKEPGHKVLDSDKIYYNNKLVQIVLKKIYVLLNKPKNCITTVSDERGRKTVMDIVGTKIKERIFPVGRLDRPTTGLLLLTNDGDLAKKLAHPSHEVSKVYHVVLDKPLPKEDIIKIKEGLTLEDGLAPVDAVHYLEENNLNKLSIELHIGRNRIVRRIFQHLGCEVIKLDRVYYAGLTKKNLPRGWFRHLTKREVIMLKHFT